MKKLFLIGLATLAMVGAQAAPVVVTPGSAAGYLYFPSATTSSAASNSNINGGTNKFLFKLAPSSIGTTGCPYYTWCTDSGTCSYTGCSTPTFAVGRAKALTIQYMGTGNITLTSAGATTGKFSGQLQRTALEVPGSGGSVSDSCTWQSTPVSCPKDYAYSYLPPTYYGSGTGFCVHSYASGWVSYKGNGSCYTVNVVDLDVVDISKM